MLSVKLLGQIVEFVCESAKECRMGRARLVDTRPVDNESDSVGMATESSSCLIDQEELEELKTLQYLLAIFVKKVTDEF